MKTLITIAFIFAIAIGTLVAQQKEPPFWNEISAFKKSDSLKFPASNQILFIGSSSFRFWTNIQKSFPGYPITNRGFGGATFKDILFYYNTIVKPYKSKQIVIYCGDNDFAFNEKLTVDSVVNRFMNLYKKIKSDNQKTTITFVSIKPSPSRKSLTTKFIETNTRIKSFLKKQSKASFVDVYSKMIDSNGVPLKAIFLPDSLHMNTQGYAIWQKEIHPHLLNK